MRRNRKLMRADFGKVGACPVSRRRRGHIFANIRMFGIFGTRYKKDWRYP